MYQFNLNYIDQIELAQLNYQFIQWIIFLSVGYWC